MSIARLMQQAAAGVPTGGGDVWTDPDLANASYDSVSFSVAGQDTSPQGLFFKPDGTKVYVVGTTGDDINEYDLSTAWDISSASYSQNFGVSSQEANPSGVFFKPDGSKMYVTGFTTGKEVYQYSLSSAWDISTASYDSVSLDVSTEDSTPRSGFFSQDGLHIFVCGLNNDTIYQYDLSLAWDLSSASYSGNSFSVTTQESVPTCLFISPSGDKLFVVGAVNDTVYQYSLSTAWDISTASYDSISFSVTSQETVPTGLFFKDDGSKMYIVGTSNDTIYQYSTVTPAAPSWTDPDLANASYDSVSFSVGDCLGMDFSEDGSNLYVNNLTFPGGDITQYSLSTPWDISTASSTGNSLDTDAQEDVPYGIKFSPDGTKLLVAGDLTDSIYEYTLSTAWDISTATYSNNSLSVSAQETSVDDLAFNSDGSKLFVLGSSSDSVLQYSLASNYSLASASYDAVSFSVSAQTNSPAGLFFSPNGDKLFVTSNNPDSVFQYSLSSSFDLSTASYDSVSFSIGSQTNSNQKVRFKSDGSKMYISDNTTDTIYQYSTA